MSKRKVELAIHVASGKCEKNWGVCFCGKEPKHRPPCVCQHGILFPAPTSNKTTVSTGIKTVEMEEEDG
jgi:hypothetical protein